MSLFWILTLGWYGLGVALFVIIAIPLGIRRGLRAVWSLGWKSLTVATLLLPLHWTVFAPEGLAWFLQDRVGTRSFERDYAGPTIDNTLVPPVQLRAADGVDLQGYFLPRDPAAPSANCAFVVVHGLFRNAFETEPVGHMLRELGVDVLLLELRNHGGSERATPTFGYNESLDVVAGVKWLRQEKRASYVGVFGVSLGGVSVAIASAATPVDAVVIDAPIADLEKTARDTFSRGRRINLPSFMIDRFLDAFQRRQGFRFADSRPIDALAKLDPEVPVHLFGGTEDRRVPLEALQHFFESLPTQRSQKSMWIGQGSAHGKVWLDYPARYRRELAQLIARIR